MVLSLCAACSGASIAHIRRMLNRNQRKTSGVAGRASAAIDPVPRAFRPAYVLRAMGALAGLAAGIVLLGSGSVDCAFAKMFHAPCPACGSTRATLALLHLDFAQALRFNPAAPFVVLVLGALGARGVYLMARDGNVQALGEGKVGGWLLRALVGALVLEVCVWALRFFGLFGGPVPV